MDTGFLENDYYVLEHFHVKSVSYFPGYSVSVNTVGVITNDQKYPWSGDSLFIGWWFGTVQNTSSAEDDSISLEAEYEFLPPD